MISDFTQDIRELEDAISVKIFDEVKKQQNCLKLTDDNLLHQELISFIYLFIYFWYY